MKKPIYVIPTGLDLDSFRHENVAEAKRQEIRERYGLDDSTRVIIYLGRIAAEKSIDKIISGVRYIQMCIRDRHKGTGYVPRYHLHCADTLR